MLKVRYVSPPIELDERVDIIIQHFPYHESKNAWTRSNYDSSIIDTPEKFEESPSFFKESQPTDNEQRYNDNNQQDLRPRYFHDRWGSSNQMPRGGYRGSSNRGYSSANPSEQRNTQYSTPVVQSNARECETWRECNYPFSQHIFKFLSWFNCLSN